MAAKEIDTEFERVYETFERAASGWSKGPQRFVLDAALFRQIYQPKGSWRTSNQTRIPIIDHNDPDAGVLWIDARLFSDGYLRGNVKARSGEIQCVAVDVGDTLGSRA